MTEIELGAQDNGQMPESTTSRQSYDALTRASASATTAGCWSRSTSGRPAHNDQKSLDQINQQKQQAEQQQQAQEQQAIEQATLQFEEAGLPPDEARAAGDRGGRVPAAHAQQQQKQQKQEKQYKQGKAYYSSPESDPRLVKLQNQISKAPDVDGVSPIELNKQGDRGRVHRASPTRPRRRSGPATSSTTFATTSSRRRSRGRR